MDKADWEAGRRVTCPMLVLWSEKSHTQREFSAREAWPNYATDIRGFRMLNCAHYPMEEAPDQLYAALSEFFDDDHTRKS
jgi:haloacetate dehalogenase